MSARVTVSSGFGPVEVREFVAALADLIEDLARERGVPVTHRTVHGLDRAPHSVDLWLAGSGEHLADLIGTHVLVARSGRRGRRARKRWFASVELARTSSLSSVALDPRDVVIESCRASSPGGQHAQKTATAIRACHVPSGITVRIEDERSQDRNRSIALARLADAVAERTRRAIAADNSARRDACLCFERGEPIRVWVASRGGLVEMRDAHAT